MRQIVKHMCPEKLFRLIVRTCAKLFSYHLFTISFAKYFGLKHLSIVNFLPQNVKIELETKNLFLEKYIKL